MASLEELFGNNDEDLFALRHVADRLSEELFVTLLKKAITPPNNSDVDNSKGTFFHQFFNLQLNSELGPKIGLMNFISEASSMCLFTFLAKVKEQANDEKIPAYREVSQHWNKNDDSFVHCTRTNKPTYYRAGDLKRIFREIAAMSADKTEEFIQHGADPKELRNMTEMMRIIVETAISKTPRSLSSPNSMVVANGWQPPHNNPGNHHGGLGGGPN